MFSDDIQSIYLELLRQKSTYAHPNTKRLMDTLPPIELSSILELIDFQLFNHFAKKAQYFYYTKLRLGTCMPTKCSKSDVELLAKTGELFFCLSRPSIMNFSAHVS